MSEGQCLSQVSPLGGAQSPLWWEDNTVAESKASLCGDTSRTTLDSWEVGRAGPGFGLGYLSEALKQVPVWSRCVGRQKSGN
jgi:hypothetical protein